MRQSWSIGALIGAVALIAACGADFRPRPSIPATSRQPEVTGKITAIRIDACDHSHLDLDSAASLELILADGAAVTARNCGATVVEHARPIAGAHTDVLLKGDLFLFGHDEDGIAWYAVAAAKGWCQSGFTLAGGAAEEGAAFHLTSGILLAKAATFNWDAPEDARYVPSTDAALCLDANGAVVEVFIVKTA